LGLHLFTEDENTMLEADGENRIRFRHLPTLAEIDTIEKDRRSTESQ
jgi:hypothetical protein